MGSRGLRTELTGVSAGLVRGPRGSPSGGPPGHHGPRVPDRPLPGIRPRLRAGPSASAGPTSARRSPVGALDLGSGGGLPGLVLAQYWPASAGVLLDSSERRTEFLERGRGRPPAGRSGSRVVRARAEDAGRRPRAAWGRSQRGVGPVVRAPAGDRRVRRSFLGPGGCWSCPSRPAPDARNSATQLTDQEAARWPQGPSRRAGAGAPDNGAEPFRLPGRRSRSIPVRIVSPAGPACPAKRPLYRVGHGG